MSSLGFSFLVTLILQILVQCLKLTSWSYFNVSVFVKDNIWNFKILKTDAESISTSVLIVLRQFAWE